MHLSIRLRFLSLFVCLLIPGCLLGSGFPSLLPKFPVGPTPAGVGVGDFNGDGKLDLVLVNQADRTITVVLGRGNGTFGAPITSTTSVPPAGPGTVFVGDFNGDHKLDIAFDASGTSVALGNGDGTFGPTVNYSVPGSGGMVGIADVNGDGKLDLVYSYEVSLTDFAAVFLGNGDGSFQPPRSSPGAFGCALADLNGDGRSDLVGGFGIQFANSDGTSLTETGNWIWSAPRFMASACCLATETERSKLLSLITSARTWTTLWWGISMVTGSQTCLSTKAFC